MPHSKHFLFFLAGCFLAASVTAQQSNLEKLLKQKDWDILFPHRIGYRDGAKKNSEADIFSYQGFLSAAKAYPVFLSGTDTFLQKKELCAILANMAFETGGGWDAAPGGYYQWGFYFAEEKNCENGCPHYSDSSKINYPPQPSRSYHGRGPLQISWNYNYGQFSENYFQDKNRLLLNPSQVIEDPVTCFASALWFWTSAQYPKPSCHDILYGNWVPNAKDSAASRLPGFGAVVNVINGGLECGGRQTASAPYRNGYYLYFCRYFGVDPGPNLACMEQKPFGL